jgi:hypothetical protein
MLRRIVLACALLLLVSPPVSAAGATVNQLSAKEKKDGWELLFDGKTIDKWRGYQQKDMTGARWTVEPDGCLSLPPAKDEKGIRDIVTLKPYGDFELAFDWKIAPGGNSGVKYLVSEDHSSAVGHEYQTIDDDKHPDAKVKDNHKTGSFYDVLPAPTAKPKAIGEINQSRILVKGNHVEHWLNGSKVLSYELDSDDLRKAIAASKFKKVPGFDKAKRGYLLLQDHGDAVCFRNIKVRDLGK